MHETVTVFRLNLSFGPTAAGYCPEPGGPGGWDGGCPVGANCRVGSVVAAPRSGASRFEPGACPTAGSVRFEDLDVFRAGRKKARYLRRKMQIVFQNPEGALNPRMRIGEILAEPLQVHRLAKGRYVKERVADLLAMVGLGPEFYHRYPWEISGGQNQRVAIARALSVKPSLLILDEPTSALDVSVQAQILQLLKATQQRMKLGYLFISHDLDVIYYIADEIAIMQRGRIVEQGDVAAIVATPQHPYTHCLLSAGPALKLDPVHPTIETAVT